MTGDRRRCPSCGDPLERDPLVGWWRCDDCALAVGADGRQLG
ncbi:hypothetical protein HTG_12475 [Natrinema mahii]|nr:hypothetical protein HTG_12475 [Natrinema mahii]